MVSVDSTPLPRVVVTRQEAAEMLGMSVDTFDDYVRPRLPMIRTGRRLYVRVRDLEAWAEENRVRIF